MEPNVGDKDLVEEPKEGMSFSSVEEVRAYYIKYAKQVGFGVTKRSSKVGDDGKVRYFTPACVRQGTSTSISSNILKLRPMEHNGCKAKINAILGSEGEFCLTHVILEHTHALSLGKVRYIRCHKRLDESMKRRLEYNDMADIQLSKNYNSCVVEAGGYENLTFGERDARNYIREVRLLQLGLGGAEALQNYFARMQAQNDGFYYVMDVDNETRLRNVFWADARSRAAYESFGDVITFDTTCVYDTLTPDEFKCCWLQFLDNFDLHDNPWLEWLYSERHLWVPAYVRNKFWARMSSTQRSEGMNAFFDDYVNSKTTLKQFVNQYDNALRRKIENELAADFSSFHTQIPCITFYGIERQFQAAYTNAKFKEVQEELRGLIYCCASMIRSERGMFTYHVADEIQVMDGFRKSTKYVVEFNEEECEASCTCQLFAFKEILCRHVIRMLTLHNKEELPAKYFLDRWRKDMKRDYTLVRSSRDNLSHSSNAHRINKLNNAFYEISSIAGISDEGCAKLMTQLTARSKGRPMSKRKQSTVEKAVNRLKARKTQRAQQNRHINRTVVGDFGSPSLAERDFPIASIAQLTVNNWGSLKEDEDEILRRVLPSEYCQVLHHNVSNTKAR
ncbi:protein FAR1-RELATED SEQUENCE 5-like [Carya illinoinensis]|uniref:protein FAR1-RELATED SEQUENCE 5-like n=1 Tax=Carya illinoinensis TaxID=32201 RepID=UPI001C725AA3|nr:protein FAR1-RELATED SEQUENCE 5-like [Carya illinoinensis]